MWGIWKCNLLCIITVMSEAKWSTENLSIYRHIRKYVLIYKSFHLNNGNIYTLKDNLHIERDPKAVSISTLYLSVRIIMAMLLYKDDPLYARIVIFKNTDAYWSKYTLQICAFRIWNSRSLFSCTFMTFHNNESLIIGLRLSEILICVTTTIASSSA